MKLAAIYSVFNNLDLLQGSINQIESEVDEIIILGQDVSFSGNTTDERVNITQNYSYIEYKCNPRLDSKVSEREKFTEGVKEAHRLGCTHFVLMACDHYYKLEDFIWAKHQIEQHDYDSTATQLHTYFKEPTFKLTPNEGYYCPFINKIQRGWLFGNKYPVYVDPALQYAPHNNFHEFKEENIVLHHYSWIRKDVEGKVLNAAARVNFKGEEQALIDEFNNFKIGDKLRYYPKHEIELVDNYFGIKEL